MRGPAPRSASLRFALRFHPTRAVALILLPFLAGLAAFLGCAQRRSAQAEVSETPLTEGDGVRTRPLCSPDGRWIAFTDAGDPARPVVQVLPVQGGTPRRLSADGSSDIALAWGAGGSVLMVYNLDAREVRGLSLDGKQVGAYATEAMAKFADLSPAGDRILWCKFTGDSYDLGVSNLAGDGGWQSLAATPEWEIDGAFGPGPKEVTVVRQPAFSSPTSEIGVLALPDRAFRTLPLAKAKNQEPVWSPDRRFLAFVSDQSGSADLWLYEPGSGRSIQLTSTPEEEVNPAWSPDGSRIVFSRRVHSSHLYVGDPATLEARPLTQGGAEDESPRVSPDGEWVAFLRRPLSGGEGPRPVLLCVASIEGGEVTPLDLGGLAPATGELTLSWSPDGEEIAFAADDGTGNVDIYRVHREGGSPTRVTIAPGLDTVPAWSPDGHRIAYMRLAGGESQIWAIAATGGIPRQLSRNAGLNQSPVWSPDSDHLAYASIPETEEVGLWVTSVSDPASARAILPGDDANFPQAWSADGTEVLVWKMRSGEWTLHAAAVDGSRLVLVAREGASGMDKHFARFEPQAERYRARVYPAGVHVYAYGDETANLFQLRIPEVIGAQFRAAGAEKDWN